VFRTWMVGCLLLPMACSTSDVRTGSLSVHSEGDSLGIPDDQKPMLVFRCELGRVGAYLVVGPPPEDSGDLPEDAVRVDLDSPPTCIATAP
jgi:hypothetical protein